MRIDNLSDVQQRKKYEILAARGFGTMVEAHYTDVIKLDTDEPEVVDATRSYYVGNAALGQLGDIVRIISVAAARGLQTKFTQNISTNVPVLEAFTDAGIMADFLSAILMEPDLEFLNEHGSVELAGDSLTAFFTHNDFFGVAERVVDFLNNVPLFRKMTSQMDLKAMLNKFRATMVGD